MLDYAGVRRVQSGVQQARSTAGGRVAIGQRFGARQVLFPNAYVWLIFVSAMDAMCTWIVLYLGGAEVNPIAQAVLGTRGFLGMVLFKFALVTLVIVFCEHIGQTRPGAALRVVAFGVAVTCIPVAWALIQVAAHLPHM